MSTGQKPRRFLRLTEKTFIETDKVAAIIQGDHLTVLATCGKQYRVGRRYHEHVLFVGAREGKLAGESQ